MIPRKIVFATGAAASEIRALKSICQFLTPPDEKPFWEPGGLDQWMVFRALVVASYCLNPKSYTYSQTPSLETGSLG